MSTILPSLMPWNTKDFAPSIWHKMYVNSLRTVQSAYSRWLESYVDYNEVVLMLSNWQSSTRYTSIRWGCSRWFDSYLSLWVIVNSAQDIPQSTEEYSKCLLNEGLNVLCHYVTLCQTLVWESNLMIVAYNEAWMY